MLTSVFRKRVNRICLNHFFCRIAFLVAFQLFVSPITPAPPRTAADKAFYEALDPEKKGDFFEALRQLTPSSLQLTDSQRQHLAHLRAFVAAQQANKFGPFLPASERATTFRELLRRLDPVDDAYLVQYGYEELNKLDVEAGSIRGSPLGQFWDRLAGSWKHRDLSKFPVSTVWVPVSMLGVVIYLLWRFWPRSGFLISFEDLTAEPSLKPRADRILMEEIQEAFWVPRVEQVYSGMEDLRVIAINDHDGSGFASLIPQKTLVVWSDIIQTNSPIKVGPIELNIKQIVALFVSWLQSPTRHALVGFLHKREDETVITAQRLNRDRRQVAGFSWKVVSEPLHDTRADLIRDLAAQMLVDLRGSELTKSWRSYRHLLLGIESLDRRPLAQDACDCFSVARRQLENALEEDPTNWMARFYLGIALRRCGANEEAARHLGVVQQLFESAEKRLANRSFLGVSYHHKSFLEKNLLRHPQCTVIVVYNHAMALSKLHNIPDMREAMRLLSAIVELCTGGREVDGLAGLRYAVDHITEAKRRQFASVARSAQAVVSAAQAEFICLTDLGTSAEDLLSSVASMELGAKQNGSTTSKERQDDPGSSEWARATILNAKGKIQSILGKSDLARQNFNTAVLLVPNMVDGYINLAASYINAGEEGPSRLVLAEKALQKAVALDSSCPKARYWLARLEQARPIANYDEALKQLDKTEGMVAGLFLRAEIYASSDYSGRDLKSSLVAWRNGLEQLPTAISRDEFHHISILWSIAELHSSDSEFQKIGIDAARHVYKHCPWQLCTEQSRAWAERSTSDHPANAAAAASG
jgi:Flp pilus assembly protein TadD